jgi:hypothetical protein
MVMGVARAAMAYWPRIMGAVARAARKIVLTKDILFSEN